MKRTDADSWDLASSVGATATMVAAARALASREENPLINDPYAEALVRAAGIDFFTRVLDGEIDLATADQSGGATMLVDVMAVRTRFFDDFFLDAAGLPATSGSAAAAGVRQAVILASGLDSRAYRLPWPDGMVVFEIDQPKVIEAKSGVMAALGASPTAERRAVAVDLRDDWPAALRANGFDDTAPAAWSAEGLLIYLPPDAQDRLFDNITALSAPGSRLATEYHADAGAGIAERSKAMSRQWSQHGLNLNMADLFYAGERNPVTPYLEGLGWDVSALTRPERFARYGRHYPDGELAAPLRDSLSITAIRT
ncbi:MAG: class I SAM-dependent methyltransferase [Mycobacterium sp.]